MIIDRKDGVHQRGIIRQTKKIQICNDNVDWNLFKIWQNFDLKKVLTQNVEGKKLNNLP